MESSQTPVKRARIAPPPPRLPVELKRPLALALPAPAAADSDLPPIERQRRSPMRPATPLARPATPRATQPATPLAAQPATPIDLTGPEPALWGLPWGAQWSADAASLTGARTTDGLAKLSLATTVSCAEAWLDQTASALTKIGISHREAVAACGHATSQLRLVASDHAAALAAARADSRAAAAAAWDAAAAAARGDPGALTRDAWLAHRYGDAPSGYAPGGYAPGGYVPGGYVPDCMPPSRKRGRDD